MLVPDALSVTVIDTGTLKIPVAVPVITPVLEIENPEGIEGVPTHDQL